jgi:hypothetical protein
MSQDNACSPASAYTPIPAFYLPVASWTHKEVAQPQEH